MTSVATGHHSANRVDPATAILETRSVGHVYADHRGWQRRSHADVVAVQGVSLRLNAGQTLGLVGESGCGKSTLARLLLRLERPTSGAVLWEGKDVWELSRAQVRELRRAVQIVFQDPYGSLNPRLTVGSALREVLHVHRLATGRAADDRIAELLDLVGLDPRDARRYPHEFSGGQRQRIGIARALSVEPAVLVADEPVSALDVSVQAQVLGLLEDLQERFHLTYLFISHDLAVVRQVSDRVAVMDHGSIIEEGPVESLFRSPQREYTRRLLEAVPRIGRKLATRPRAT
jgi:ABC-type glutathione transport system ATPase component